MPFGFLVYLVECGGVVPSFKKNNNKKRFNWKKTLHLFGLLGRMWWCGSKFQKKKKIQLKENFTSVMNCEVIWSWLNLLVRISFQKKLFYCLCLQVSKKKKRKKTKRKKIKKLCKKVRQGIRTPDLTEHTNT